MRVAVATCKKLPEPDPDEPGLRDALRAAGIQAELLAWDDPSAPFADHDLIVLRSTWNYYERVEDFVAWVERLSRTNHVLNPARIVAWNARKTYLVELEERGIDIVPTEIVPRGKRRTLEDILKAHGWEDVVIKPVVSAGSFRTERFSLATLAAGETFLADLVADRDAMVQRWVPSVETYGERSLVWIDGEVTHAIRKTARFSGDREQVSAAVPVADDERAFAQRVLEPLASELLYARVDMVRDDEGLRLMELELIEPSLFFCQHEPALARFVARILHRG